MLTLPCAPQDPGNEDAWVLQPLSHRSGEGSTAADALALEAASLEPTAVGAGVRNASTANTDSARNVPKPQTLLADTTEPLDGRTRKVVANKNIRTVFPSPLVPAFSCLLLPSVRAEFCERTRACVTLRVFACE
jgi:hypothetical protein